MTDSPQEGSVSEEMAARVLERATQLEVDHGGDIDVAELRRVALEAGIPLDAFERALAEARAALGRETDSDPPSQLHETASGSRPKLWLRRAALAGFGSAIAAASAALTPLFGVDTGAAAIFSVVLAALSAFGLAWARRGERSVVEFLFDIVPLWLGFTLAWMIVHPRDALEILAVTGLIGVIGALVLSIVVALPPFRRPANELAQPNDPRFLKSGSS